MRGLAVAAHVAWARARARKAQILIASFAIAAAVGALMVMVALPKVGEELVLRHTIERLRPEDRAVTVVVATDHLLEAKELRAIDSRLQKRFANLPLGPLRSLVEFRSLATPDGTIFRLGGLQNLSTAVRVEEGRLPKSCTPTRCEVIQIGPTGGPRLTEPAPGLVVVGRAIQIDPLPFTGDLSLLKEEHLVLADGTLTVNDFTSLLLIRRSHAWVAPIDPKLITRSSVGPLLQSLAAAGSDTDITGYSVTAPDDGLADALNRAVVAGRSLALPISQGALLLCGVLVIIALAIRNQQQAAADRLSRRGARPAIVSAFDLLSTATVVGLGAALGTILGALGTVLLARHFTLPASTVLRSTWSPGAIAGFVMLMLGVLAATTILVRIRDPKNVTRRRGLRPSDLAVLVAGAILTVLVNRGDASADSLASRSDPLLWAMPLLVATLIAALSPRIIPIMMRTGAHFFPAHRTLDRVALLDSVRRPVRSLATAAMIGTALAFATFTFGYRSTLLQSAQDQAAFAVPFDVRLTVGGELVQPPKLRPKAGWRALAPGTVATEVLRRSASLRRTGTAVDTVDVVGIEPASLSALRSWRSDYGPPIPTLIRELTTPAPSPIGSLIPESADALKLDIDGPAEFTKLAVVIERRDGSWHETVATLGTDDKPVIALEPADKGGRFIGIRVAQLDETASRIEHHVLEGNTSVEAMEVGFILHGIAALSNGQELSNLDYEANVWDDAVGDVRGQPDGSVSIAATILGTSRLIVPTFEHDPIPALVDPVTASAAVDGIVTVETQGSEFQFRVVATAQRFPTLSDRFVLTDLRVLSRGFNLAQPGYGMPIETWLAADTPRHERGLFNALSNRPFSTVDTDRRIDRVSDNRSDPLARLSLAVLTWSALLAGLMVVGSLLLNSMAERTDDEPFHRSLSLEGAPLSTIRRLVTLRTVSLAFAALPMGIAAGALMTKLVTSAIRLTADAVSPNPPLRRIVPWTSLGVALVLFALLACLAAGAGARVARKIGPAGLLRERA